MVKKLPVSHWEDNVCYLGFILTWISTPSSFSSNPLFFIISFFNISLCLNRSICRREFCEAFFLLSSRGTVGVTCTGGGGGGCTLVRGAASGGAGEGAAGGVGEGARVDRARLRGLFSTQSSSSSARRRIEPVGDGGDCGGGGLYSLSICPSGFICFS